LPLVQIELGLRFGNRGLNCQEMVQRERGGVGRVCVNVPGGQCVGRDGHTVLAVITVLPGCHFLHPVSGSYCCSSCLLFTVLYSTELHLPLASAHCSVISLSLSLSLSWDVAVVESRQCRRGHSTHRVRADSPTEHLPQAHPLPYPRYPAYPPNLHIFDVEMPAGMGTVRYVASPG